MTSCLRANKYKEILCPKQYNQQQQSPPEMVGKNNLYINQMKNENAKFRLIYNQYCRWHLKVDPVKSHMNLGNHLVRKSGLVNFIWRWIPIVYPNRRKVSRRIIVTTNCFVVSWRMPVLNKNPANYTWSSSDISFRHDDLWRSQFSVR